MIHIHELLLDHFLSLPHSLSFFLLSPPSSLPPRPAVRNGDLVLFSNTLDSFGTQFQTERTYTLIVRLRHNVIKTGIRMISLSYSRISLSDIAEKLQLDSSIDAEYIVAKVMLYSICNTCR